MTIWKTQRAQLAPLSSGQVNLEEKKSTLLNSTQTIPSLQRNPIFFTRNFPQTNPAYLELSPSWAQYISTISYGPSKVQMSGITFHLLMHDKSM